MCHVIVSPGAEDPAEVIQHCVKFILQFFQQLTGLSIQLGDKHSITRHISYGTYCTQFQTHTVRENIFMFRITNRNGSDNHSCIICIQGPKCTLTRVQVDIFEFRYHTVKMFIVSIGLGFSYFKMIFCYIDRKTSHKGGFL